VVAVSHDVILEAEIFYEILTEAFMKLVAV
jgi:hypothetical protein